jgi:hypothetical protein
VRLEESMLADFQRQVMVAQTRTPTA